MICYQELLDMLESSTIKSDLACALKEIREDQKLLADIETYHRTYDEDMRKKIYQNQLYKNYKKLENRLNMLILSSNQILGKIKNENH